MKKKLRLFLLATVFAATLILPACSQQEEKPIVDNSQDTEIENSQVQKKSTLTLYFYEAMYAEMFDAAIIKFNEAYPDVQVKKIGKCQLYKLGFFI